MPAGLLALLAIPFGLDGILWRLMGDGIDWMITVALFVAHLPGAVGRMAAFGTGPLLLGTGGLLVVCLLKTPLRWAGAVVIVLSTVWAIRTPQPDVLVASDGQAVAVRGADGRLMIQHTSRDAFTVKEWLAADADARLAKDKALEQGFRCDGSGCLVTMPDGRLLSQVLAPDAFEEDCRRAAIVVTSREAPPDCKALAIDRKAWRGHGATALRKLGEGWDITTARPAGLDRPWARSADVAAQPPPTTTPPSPRDATPRAEDLEAGD
jgi:competence protein ComEC